MIDRDREARAQVVSLRAFRLRQHRSSSSSSSSRRAAAASRRAPPSAVGSSSPASAGWLWVGARTVRRPAPAPARRSVVVSRRGGGESSAAPVLGWAGLGREGRDGGGTHWCSSRAEQQPGGGSTAPVERYPVAGTMD